MSKVIMFPNSHDLSKVDEDVIKAEVQFISDEVLDQISEYTQDVEMLSLVCISILAAIGDACPDMTDAIKADVNNLLN